MGVSSGLEQRHSASQDPPRHWLLGVCTTVSPSEGAWASGQLVSDCRGGEEADYKGIPKEISQRTLSGIDTALYPDCGDGFTILYM